MSNTAVRRMYTDIKQFQAANLENDGIFCSFNEDDLFDVKAMVVGPKDTPYEDGFYFFRLTFPKNYPFAPPKAVFETRYNTTHAKLRFNPNLYANGKVCVSLLGTWSGPQWEPCQSLYSILLAFQTLLVEEPLTNEPGYSKVTPSQAKKHQTYTAMVAFENYRVAILRMLDHPPDGFEAFIPIMQQWTHQRAAAIEARLAKAVEAAPEAKTLECAVYSAFRTVVDYPRICAEFAQVRSQLHAALAGSGSGGSGDVGSSDDPPAASEDGSTAAATPATGPTPPAPPPPEEAPHPTPPASVGAEVEAAVTAFAQASLADAGSAPPTTTQAAAPSAPSKSKRKRPDTKANAQHYAVVEVPQPAGQPIAYQSVPSEYTRAGKAGEPPTKRTRWLWRRLDAKHPAVVPPGAASAAGPAVVL
jgi:ubiquitin-protein ligase